MSANGKGIVGFDGRDRSRPDPGDEARRTILELPEPLRRKLDHIKREIHSGRELPVVCPAGRAGRFTDTGAHYCFCTIERQPIAIRNGAVALASFCCNEDFVTCDTWQAGQRDDPMIKRAHAAGEARERERQTQRQIETGMRVDDRDEREAKEIIEDERPHGQALSSEEGRSDADDQ